MKKKIGLWIDHKKAVIVILVREDEAIKIIESNLERHVHPSGGSRSKTPYGPQDIVPEDRRERKYDLHVSKYYDEVISSIKDADSVFIFGPGEAKNKFIKHIKNKELQSRILAVETVDKMTEAQIAVKVRNFFQK
jgi:stalled ribosome rescue protein Dom34